ncbi:MAG: YihY/virulence factor BrkB family protein, partial [Blastocatellia bacterium]|nr:YihY/virulence factor BrkB family protein [Blastocatellia bacterium]
MTTHNRVEPVETFHRPASVTMRLVNRTTLIKRSVWSSIAEITSTQTYSHTSAIAFNALLSFFPFIILLLVICSKVLRWEEGFEMILTLLKEHYLPVSEEFITKSLRAIANSNKVALFSIGSLIFTSAGLFAPIELALNHAWQVREERPFWKSQLIAFGLVIGCGLLAM